MLNNHKKWQTIEAKNGNDIAELFWLEEKLKFKYNTLFGSLNHFGQNVLH